MSNKGGGCVLLFEEFCVIGVFVYEYEFVYYFDGVWFCNVFVVEGIEVKEVGCFFDLILLCLSKGFGCFVGLFLFGECDFICEVCCVCKCFGGGWCQVGYFVVVGIYVFDYYVECFFEDYVKVECFGDCVFSRFWVGDVSLVEMNIVVFCFFDVECMNDFFEQMCDCGLCVSYFGGGVLCMVMYFDVSDVDVDSVCIVLESLSLQ